MGGTSCVDNLATCGYRVDFECSLIQPAKSELRGGFVYVFSHGVHVSTG